MSDEAAKRRRTTWMMLAAAVLAALSLACGVGSAHPVPACQNAPTGDECTACCSREGFSGHLYNSLDQPPCECM